MIAYAALIEDEDDLLKYNELVDQYQTEMYHIARRITEDHHLAEDAVQNALYGIAVSFKNVPTDNPDAAHTYMLSCAKYAALRIQKSERQHSTVELSTVLDTSSGVDSTFEAIQQSDAYEQLLRAIQQLGEEYQDVLLHFYVYEQSVKEIAKLFGEKPSTIRQRLTRARRLLSEICRKEGIVCA